MEAETITEVIAIIGIFWGMSVIAHLLWRLK